MLKGRNKKIQKLRDYARDQNCMIRLGCCNHNNKTTILAHVYPKGTKAMGAKGLDLIAVWSCSSCHDAIDGRLKTGYGKDYLQEMAFLGAYQTILKLQEKKMISGNLEPSFKYAAANDYEQALIAVEELYHSHEINVKGVK